MGTLALVKRDPDVYCNARKKGHGDEGYCTQRAGWGTSHPSVGRCKLHGGASPLYEKTALVQAAINPPPETSAPSNLRERALEYQWDPNLLDLKREIAGLRAMEEKLNVTLNQDGETRDFAAIKSYFMIANTIGKLVEKQEALLRGRKYMIPIQTVIDWADGVGAILQKHIQDPKLLAAIAKEVAQLSERNDNFP